MSSGDESDEVVKSPVNQDDSSNDSDGPGSQKEQQSPGGQPGVDDSDDNDSDVAPKRKPVIEDSSNDSDGPSAKSPIQEVLERDVSDNESEKSAGSPKKLSPQADKDDDSNDSDIKINRRKRVKQDDSDNDSDAKKQDSDNENAGADPVVAAGGGHASGSDSDTARKDAKDIFGDVSSDEEDKKSVGRGSVDGSPRADDAGVEGEDGVHVKEEVEEPAPEMRIEVEIPRVVANLGKEINFVKLPNFLSVDTHPYDPQWYEDEIDEDEVLDEEGRARMKLKVENTIRWRTAVDDEGNMKKESNARVVKWSDGSMSLHLGAEIFDIHKQTMMAGDNNHLFIRQGTGLQGQAVFKTKLSFRPHSTDSFTHRKMTLSLADRSQKNHQIKVLPTVGADPEADRSKKMKEEEDKLKALVRRENKQRRHRERSHTNRPSASYLEPGYDDDDDEEGGISLSRIKNTYKKGGPGGGGGGNNSYAHTYTDSEDDGSDVEFGSSKKTVKRAKIESDEDD